MNEPFLLLLGTPLLGVFFAALPLRPAWHLRFLPLPPLVVLLTGAAAAWSSVGGAVRLGAGDWLLLDALSAFHVSLVGLVFFLSSLYATGYFGREVRERQFPPARIRAFAALWQAFLGALMLALLANHPGLLWVSIEGSTLASAFLILTDHRRASIEAMWKYLLLCSVGILFAFVGILLLATASGGTAAADLRWTSLAARAGTLDPRLTLAAFVFALVGFGTKAGLAPMHSWLPDAHSQAPTPVSAVFSGVMLNCALYAVLRYLPLAEGALGNSGQARQLLLGLGLFSMVISAVFIPAQTDIKRLLAYCSVEHMGIMAVGLGLGGAGVWAALFHALNHSLAKTLAFFSAGRLVQCYDTHDMNKMSGAAEAVPVWGKTFFLSILALGGAAPFATFLSEFFILKTAADHSRPWVLGVFLVAAAVPLITLLRRALQVSYGSAQSGTLPGARLRGDIWLAGCLLVPLVVLGVWIPNPLVHFLHLAASTLTGIR